MLTPPEGYLPFFSDEFDYVGAPNPAKWGVETSGTSDPTYATVDGSKLILRTTGTQHSDRKSGNVRTTDSRYLVTRGAIGMTRAWPSPGWLEIRMKPATRPAGAAVNGVMTELVLWSGWPYAQAGDFDTNAEIDIAEARGLEPGIIHSGSRAWDSGGSPNGQGQGNPVAPGEYHQFVTHFSRTWVRNYIDDVLVHQRNLASDSAPVFGFPVGLVMGCWIGTAGDGWAGAAGVDYPIDVTAEVDYVRYYTQGQDDGSAML